MTLIPDIEAVVVDWLRDDPDILNLNANVAGQLPRSFTKPWIRVTQLDATDAAAPADYLISYLVQLDCFAGSKANHAQNEASVLGRTARSVLHDLRGQVVNDVVISEVEVRTHARIPDTNFDPPRERVVVDFEISAHPV